MSINKKEIEYYRKNIEILNVDIVTESFLGEKLILEIKDNNNKFFKKRKIKESYLEIYDLSSAIEKTLERYIWKTKRYEILYNRHQNMVKRWKEQNVR